MLYRLLLAGLSTLALASCDTPSTASDAGPTAVDAGPTDAGPPADTWSNFAEGFSQTYCVECHGGATRDLSTLEGMRANAARSRCGVSDVALDDCGSSPAPRQFPVGSGPQPSDDDRARFVAWVEAGTPE